MILHLTACTVDLDDGTVSGARPSRLTQRERDLLRFLAERPGVPTSRDDLLRDVFGYHPDAQSRAVDKAMSSLRQKVERDTSSPDHLRTVPGGYTFTPLSAPIANGPVERDGFVGRGEELRALERMLATPGLVSLAGPAGVGKSRLAGRALVGIGREVVRCDLAPAATEDDVVRTVGRALSCPVAPTADQLSGQIGVALGARGDAVLLLDGFEHLLGHAGRLREWLVAAPRASVLVTTQQAVGLEGERVLRLAPLSRDAAVELLQVRARERGVELGSEPDLDALAASLDDLPLALELAAARLGVLSPSELIARLEHRLELLRSPFRDAPSRRASLRGMLDGSWALCTDPERTALAELSLFVGDFDLAAAEAVLSPPADGRLAVDVLAELVDRSLVQRRQGRFGLLRTVRAYAAERLRDLGEAAVRQTEAAHLRWFARLFAPGTDPIDTTGLERRAIAYHPLFEDALAACHRAVAVGDRDAAVRLVGVLGVMSERGGSREDWAALLGRLLDLPLSLRERCWVRAWLGRTVLFDDPREAIRLYEQVVAEAVEVGDVGLESRGLCLLGTALGFQSRDEEAEACFVRGLALTPHGASAGQHRMGLGQLLAQTSRGLEALEHLRAAETALSRADFPSGAANARLTAGIALYVLGRFDEARERLAAAREAFRAIDHLDGQLRAEGMSAAVAAEGGDHEQAVATYRRVADRWRAAGARRGYVAYLTNLAAELYELGRVDEALEALAEAGTQLEALGTPEMTNRVIRLEAACLTKLGRAREALGLLADVPETASTPIGLGDLLIRAEILAHAGELDEARAIVDRVEHGVRSMDLTPESIVARRLAEVRAELVRLSAAGG